MQVPFFSLPAVSLIWSHLPAIAAILAQKTQKAPASGHSTTNPMASYGFLWRVSHNDIEKSKSQRVCHEEIQGEMRN
jgi:hypothetical protein